MTTPLTPARFAELAEAYGGTIARWPEAVRAEAQALARDPALTALLAEADALDARLDAWRVPAPDATLRQRVIAGWSPSLLRRFRLWWAGIGIATALAGAAAGSMAAAALPSDHVQAEEATAFGSLAGQER